MRKERLALFLGALLILSIFVTTLGTAQDTNTGPRDLPFLPDLIEGPIENFLHLWESGGGIDETALKYFFLGIVVILIYSSLSYVNFPSRGGYVTRIILSILVGFLATALIAQEELIAAMQSYTALGIALIVFLPTLILGFFTIMVASKASPMGIYFQKITWVIYSTYLFIRSGFGLYANLAVTKFGEGAVLAQNNYTLTKFFLGNSTEYFTNAQATGIGGGNIILLVLFVVSIAIFIIMVWWNKPVIAWLAKEKIDAEAEAQKAMIERSQEYDKARSEAMENQ